MTVKEASNYLGCSYWQILQLVKQKKIPFISMGNRKLFRRDSLDLWLSEKESLSMHQSHIDNGKIRKISD
jgi:excisionase family DNA binding protein